jgi:hypothetical protein
VARSCIFCGSTSKLTKEHVLPAWLLRKVGGAYGGEQGGSFRGTHLSSIGCTLSERKFAGDQHQAKLVCGVCNHGWMSRLETAFATLLPRIQADTSPRSFSKRERQKIALWLLKTAIMVQQSANYRKILPDDLGRDLSRGTTVPRATKVFYGTVRNPETIRWAQSNFAMALVRPADSISIDYKTDTFVIALAIEHTLLVLGWHNLNQDEFEAFCIGEVLSELYPHPRLAKKADSIDDIVGAARLIGLRRR